MKRLPSRPYWPFSQAGCCGACRAPGAHLFVVGLGLGAVLAGQRFGFTPAGACSSRTRTPAVRRRPAPAAQRWPRLAITAAGPLPELTAIGPAQRQPAGCVRVRPVHADSRAAAAARCTRPTWAFRERRHPAAVRAGQLLGSLHLGFWLDLGRSQPVGLVGQFGWERAPLITLAALAAIGRNRGLVRAPPPAPLVAKPGAGRWWLRKWMVGAVLLAVLAALNLVIAGQPWGVVYGFRPVGGQAGPGQRRSRPWRLALVLEPAGRRQRGCTKRCSWT